MASFSNSNSSSYIPDYSETSILEEIANLASTYGKNLYNWASNEYASNSTITNEAVSKYLDAANLSYNTANNSYNRYTQEYWPLEDQLVGDANTYASEARVRSEMGAAESGVAQSYDAARKNYEQELQSYGIDPSSGRYAELERANDASEAAAKAGAAQTARYNTEKTARELRAQAISVGEQYPSNIANMLNSTNNSLSGAVNSKLANTNTASNAFKTANDYLGTGMNLKYSPLGNKSSSAGSSNDGSGGRGSGSGSGNNGSGRGAGNGNGGGNNSGYGTSDPNYSANPRSYHFGNGTGDKTIGVNGGDGSDNSGYDASGGWGFDNQDQGSGTTANDGMGLYDQSSDPWNSGDNQASDVASGDEWGGGGGFGQDQYGQDTGNQFNGGQNDYYDGGAAFGSDNSGSAGGNDSSNNDWGWGNSDPYGGSGDTGDSGYTDTGGYDYAAGGPVYDPQQDGVIDDSGDNGASYGMTVGNATNNNTSGAGWSGSNTTPNYSGGHAGIQGGQMNSGYGFAFGRGGPMPNRPTTGGFVPPHASPSAGRQTDDIPARLNANEFVIPRDVALWKGQEFFQKLIDQSRKARGAAPAKPQMAAAPKGAPRFVSQGAQ